MGKRLCVSVTVPPLGLARVRAPSKTVGEGTESVWFNTGNSKQVKVYEGELDSSEAVIEYESPGLAYLQVALKELQNGCRKRGTGGVNSLLTDAATSFTQTPGKGFEAYRWNGSLWKPKGMIPSALVETAVEILSFENSLGAEIFRGQEYVRVMLRALAALKK